uniref:Uncharacterized protein n=1 Tax=Daphnia galeata TaxID=27404 RepID=A0A8J2WC61_9CRUS|nr:unnamed protein product [Daphnia galeata]
MKHCMILLASKFNVEKILPAKLVQRFSSGISLFTSQEKVPVIMKEYSNRKVADRLVQEYRWRRTLQFSGKLEIDTSSVKNHFLRVYFGLLYSPVLGDHIFGNRVQDIKGKRLAISPIQADNLSN